MSVTETDSVLLNEGKTKRIMQIAPHEGETQEKNDITAGDGKKHDVISGKAELCASTTSNVFKLLKACDVPVAFHSQNSSTTFLMPLCDMLPWEVVVRRKAKGSYLKRNPEVQKGTHFNPLIVEFYLKTKGRKWKDYVLSCDDPYAIISDEYVYLFLPSEPVVPGEHFLKLPIAEVTLGIGAALFPQMGKIAVNAFKVTELAWKLLDNGCELDDFKVECGLSTRDGSLLLADEITNDSWRVTRNGDQVDKQGYRDGDDLLTVLHNYQWVDQQVAKFPDLVRQVLAQLCS